MVLVVADFVVVVGGSGSYCCFCCSCFCCSCFCCSSFCCSSFCCSCFVVVLVSGGGGFCVVFPPFFSGDHQTLEEHRPCKVTLLTLNAVIMLMIQDARSLKMVQFILSFFVYIL